MATTTTSIRRFLTTAPARTNRTWKIKVRDGDAMNRRRRWLYLALFVVFMLTFIGWLMWLSITEPQNVSLHDIWMP